MEPKNAQVDSRMQSMTFADAVDFQVNNKWQKLETRLFSGQSDLSVQKKKRRKKMAVIIII